MRNGGVKLISSVLVFAVAVSACGGTDELTAPATSTSTGPTTQPFNSLIRRGGSSGHNFSITESGVITATVLKVEPSVPIGVGIGVPKEGSSVCSLATSMVTTAEFTPSLSAAVDAGSYCVQVFDAGHLTDSDVAFSISITSPSITSTP
jgi:hypothetical protein